MISQGINKWFFIIVSAFIILVFVSFQPEYESILLTKDIRIRDPFIYANNGGHGMIFRTFGGSLMMALHQPNTEGKERLHLFQITDDGETLYIEGEFKMN